MNGFFNFRKLVVGVMAATCFMGFQSCLDDDDDYPYSKVLPNALSYLIESVEVLQTKVNALQHKQASNSPKWMDIDELCAYLPSHPAKQTVYGWVSTKQIPVHKINKALAFLQSEIDDWLKNKSHKTQDDLMEEAKRFVESKKIIR